MLERCSFAAERSSTMKPRCRVSARSFLSCSPSSLRRMYLPRITTSAMDSASRLSVLRPRMSPAEDADVTIGLITSTTHPFFERKS